jgi:hypothetical protein
MVHARKKLHKKTYKIVLLLSPFYNKKLYINPLQKNHISVFSLFVMLNEVKHPDLFYQE